MGALAVKFGMGAEQGGGPPSKWWRQTGGSQPQLCRSDEPLDGTERDVRKALLPAQRTFLTYGSYEHQ